MVTLGNWLGDRYIKGDRYIQVSFPETEYIRQMKIGNVVR